MSISKSGDITSTQKEKKKTSSWLFFFIVFVLVFILVVYYFSEIKKEFILLEKVNPYWLIAALLAQFMTYFFTALVYLFLIKAYKATNLPSLWSLMKASIISLFFNQTVPSAGISGNTFFYNFLTRYNMERTQIISLILGELLIFYAAMEVIILSLLVSCIYFYESLYAFKSTLAAGFVVYLIFSLVIVLAGRKNMLDRLYQKIIKSRLIKKIFKKLRNEIPDETISMNETKLSVILKNNKQFVARTFFFRLLTVAADAFTLYVLFLGLGYPVSPFIVLLSLISTKIISILPFLPGALILYESSMSFFFADAGVPAGTAIIATLVYRLLSFWFPMPVGTLLYRRWLKNAPTAENIIRA